MSKIQDIIAGVLSIIGLYFILVSFSVFEYPINLKELFSNRISIFLVGLLFILFSYFVSSLNIFIIQKSNKEKRRK